MQEEFGRHACWAWLQLSLEIECMIVGWSDENHWSSDSGPLGWF